MFPIEQPSDVLESFGFYDDYKPTLRILQEGLGNGGASALLFFCGFVDYITGIWSYLQGFFQIYNKVGRNGWDSAAVGIVVMCITPLLMELWATLFAGCGKAALCFSICCEWCCP